MSEDMSQINRRALLGAVPAVALAPAAVLAMPSAEPGPIERMLHEWEAYRRAYNSLADEDAGQPFFDRHVEIEKEISGMEPTSLRELYCKIIVADDRGDLTVNSIAAALADEAKAAIGWPVAREDLPEVGALSPAVVSPIMVLFQDWKAVRSLLDDPESRLSDAEQDELIDRISDIEKSIMGEPSKTAEDFIVKVVSWTSFGVFALDDFNEHDAMFWDDALRLIGGAA